MIQFRCSGCNKALGVDEEFGGKLIKCPACQCATRVPMSERRDVVEAVPVASIEAPTLDHIPKVAVHPACPNCQTELFNPSDNVCGVCGNLLDQDLGGTARSVVTASSEKKASVRPGVIPGYSVEPYEALPVNPALESASHSALPYKTDQYDSSKGSSIRRGPTTGKSIAGWVTGVATGMFCALVWGVVASFFGTWVQAIGWGIGALVGFIAGIIARNPSMKFCISASLGAILCMLFGRIVSAWVIMATVSTMGAFGTILMPDNGVTVGVMERLIDEEVLNEFEADYAQSKVDEFFANESAIDEDLGEYEEFASEEEIEVDLKVRKIVREMSPEEKEKLLEEVRLKHPDWIEKEWHRMAVVDSLVQNNEIEDVTIKDHANAMLTRLEGIYEGDYFEKTSQQERYERELKLTKLAGEKYASLSPGQRKDVYLAARKKHLTWNPVQHEYLAMLDCMYQNDEIPKELKPFAKSQINQQLEMIFDDAIEEYGEDFDMESYQKSQNLLSKIVNEKLLELSDEEIKELVSQTKKRYPGFVAEEYDLMDDLAAGLDDTIARFESDGTFLGSLKTRFKRMDCVWLCLGAISAFAIAFTLGQSGKRASS